MGFLGPFEFKNSKGNKFYLHMKERGKTRVFFFSKEPYDALSFLPSGFSVIESKKTGLPMLKRGGSGIFDMMLNTPKSGKERKGKK